MASPNAFAPVRGRMMRVTRVDGCCSPVFGPESQVVSEGFVSIAFTANQNEGEEISVTNAAGKICVKDTPCPEFTSYTLEITFCEVQPCLYSMLTGQPVIEDASGNIIGFKMNSKVSVCDSGFALEIWTGVPGVACGAGGAPGASAGSYGYLLLPCVRPGVIGDFTIENAAISFVVTGATTKDGNAWGTGPYDVLLDAGGVAGPLPTALDVDDHLYVAYSEVAPPVATDGCVALAT